MVSCWTVDGKARPSSTYSNNGQHSGAITVLKWNPLGKRLVTGDKVFLFIIIKQCFIYYYFSYDYYSNFYILNMK